MSKHDALSVANVLIKKGIDDSKPLTPLQVIKLAYFCQGWMLGLYGRPLFKQDIEAWRYGPVIADVYYALKHYGRRPVADPIPGVPEEEFDALESNLMDQVHEVYGKLDGWRLSRLTHMKGTPWDTFNPRGGQAVIPTTEIERYYARAAEEAEAA